ncbi:MAG: haloalkane dehalogenase [Calditrichaceae bacterium]
MNILKPDISAFKQLRDFPYRENFVGFKQFTMHYIDEGKGETILALHGEPTWSYLYRKFIPVLHNYRFIAPDFIGFGKSDKIAGWQNYSFDLHFQSIKSLIDKLALKNITLVVQDWGGLIGLSVLGANPKKFKRVVIMNTALPVGGRLPATLKIWTTFARYYPSLPIGLIMQAGACNRLSTDVINAYKIPFPSKKYKSGVKAFPMMIPGNPSDQGVKELKMAQDVLSCWIKPVLILFSDKDPFFSRYYQFFDSLIPDSAYKKKVRIKNAGHYLQEDKGREIAHYIAQFAGKY